MQTVRGMDGLARALLDNDWVASKTTEKTMAIMSGMSHVPWDKVKMFHLRWEVVGGEIVPNVNVMMFGEGEEGEPDIEVEIPDGTERPNKAVKVEEE